MTFRMFVLLAALLPAFASAQGVRLRGYSSAYRSPYQPGGVTDNRPIMTLPLTQVGAPYSSAYSILWRGWVENGAWQQTGSLTFTPGSATYQTPSELPTTQAGGGISGAALSSTDNVSAANRMLCVLFAVRQWPTAMTPVTLFRADSSTGGIGWAYIGVAVGGTGLYTTGGLVIGTNGTGTANNSSPLVPGLNAACFGVTGAAGYASLNLTTAVTNADFDVPWDLSAQSFLSTNPTLISIIDAVWVDSAWNVAISNEIQRRWLGLYQGGNLLTASRASLKSVPINGFVSHVPAAVPAVSGDGILVEKATTNYALYSGAMSSGSAGRTGWGLSSASISTRTAEAPDKTDSTRLTSSNTTGSFYRTSATFGSTTGPFVLSVYAKADSGTDTVTLLGGCGANSASSLYCSRSDGGSCTTGTFSSGQLAAAWGTVGTDWVRFSLRYVCSAAQTAITIYLHDGQYQTSFGNVADFAMAQVEVQPYVTGYQRSEGTATARSEDLFYATLPGGVPPADWSVTQSAAPACSLPWRPPVFSGNVGKTFFGVNTSGAANSARVDMSTANNGISGIAYSTANFRTRLSTAWPSVLNGSSRTQACFRFTSTMDTWTPLFNGVFDGTMGAASGSGTGSITTWPTGQPFFIGTSGAGGASDMWVRDMRLYGKAVCR